jgi:KDO2-lipid IV(A) lauroyltransferase
MSRFAPARYAASDRRARVAWARFHPDAADAAGTDAAMRRLWRNVGRTMAEFSALDRLWESGRIAVSGLEHIAAARDGNVPAIVAGLHLGNWETLGLTLSRSGFPGVGPYEAPANRFEHRIAVKARRRYGGRPLAPDRAAGRTIYRIVAKERYGILIYIDEIRRGRVSAPFLGRAPRRDGNIAYIARLAAATGAVILPAYCARLGDRAHFAVTFLPPVDLSRTGDRDRDLGENIARIDAVIDPIVRAHIDQWYYALDIDLDS